MVWCCNKNKKVGGTRKSGYSSRMMAFAKGSVWGVIIALTLLGLFMLAYGVVRMNAHTGYFPCTCKGTSFESQPSECVEQPGFNSVGSILSWIGNIYNQVDVEQPGDSGTPPPGDCFRAYMNCTLDCGVLKLQYPIYEVMHRCHHIPVADLDSISGACAADFNDPPTYYINPCAWNNGLWNATNHGPKEYLYDGAIRMCGAFQDLRPALDEALDLVEWQWLISIGCILMIFCILWFCISCVRCCWANVKSNNKMRKAADRERAGEDSSDEEHLSYEDEDAADFGMKKTQRSHGKKGKRGEAQTSTLLDSAHSESEEEHKAGEFTQYAPVQRNGTSAKFAVAVHLSDNDDLA